MGTARWELQCVNLCAAEMKAEAGSGCYDCLLALQALWQQLSLSAISYQHVQVRGPVCNSTYSYSTDLHSRHAAALQSVCSIALRCTGSVRIACPQHQMLTLLLPLIMFETAA